MSVNGSTRHTSSAPTTLAAGTAHGNGSLDSNATAIPTRPKTPNKQEHRAGSLQNRISKGQATPKQRHNKDLPSFSDREIDPGKYFWGWMFGTTELAKEIWCPKDDTINKKYLYSALNRHDEEGTNDYSLRQWGRRGMFFNYLLYLPHIFLWIDSLIQKTHPIIFHDIQCMIQSVPSFVWATFSTLSSCFAFIGALFGIASESLNIKRQVSFRSECGLWDLNEINENNIKAIAKKVIKSLDDKSHLKKEMEDLLENYQPTDERRAIQEKNKAQFFDQLKAKIYYSHFREIKRNYFQLSKKDKKTIHEKTQHIAKDAFKNYAKKQLENEILQNKQIALARRVRPIYVKEMRKQLSPKDQDLLNKLRNLKKYNSFEQQGILSSANNLVQKVDTQSKKLLATHVIGLIAMILLAVGSFLLLAGLPVLAPAILVSLAGGLEMFKFLFIQTTLDSPGWQVSFSKVLPKCLLDLWFQLANPVKRRLAGAVR